MLLAPGVARAEPWAVDPGLLVSAPPEIPPPRVWYGWEILVPAAVINGIGVLGAANGNQGLAWSGIAALSTPGPVIHALHGDTRKGIMSLGLNLTGAAAGALLGGLLAPCPRPPRSAEVQVCWPLEQIWLGAFIGLQTAVVMDAMTLAWGKPLAPGWAGIPKRRLAVTPSFVVGPGGSAVGVVGRF